MGVKTFDKANPARKQNEVYQDFSGGLNTELADSATKDNQFRKLVNFDMDKAGSLSKRPGLYRIPYVKRDIEKLLTDQGISLVDLNILDVEPFYDGAHWIFNYITNKGLIFIILDNQLNKPVDLTYTLNGVEQTYPHVHFVPYSDQTEDKTRYQIKIAKYNDIFVMYKTFYAKPDWTLGADVKQVLLYSWCPILKPVSNGSGGIDPDKSLLPGWVEATDDKDNIKEDTFYGNEETLIAKSNILKGLLDEIISSGDILNILGVDQYYNAPPSAWDNLAIKVSYHNNTLNPLAGAYLVLTYHNFLTNTKTSYDILLKHPTGINIKDEDINQIVMEDATTIKVFLHIPIQHSPVPTNMRHLYEQDYYFTITIPSNDKTTPTITYNTFNYQDYSIFPDLPDFYQKQDLYSAKISPFTLPGVSNTSRSANIILQRQNQTIKGETPVHSQVWVPYNVYINFWWHSYDYPLEAAEPLIGHRPYNLLHTPAANTNTKVSVDPAKAHAGPVYPYNDDLEDYISFENDITILDKSAANEWIGSPIIANAPVEYNSEAIPSYRYDVLRFKTTELKDVDRTVCMGNTTYSIPRYGGWYSYTRFAAFTHSTPHSTYKNKIFSASKFAMFTTQFRLKYKRGFDPEQKKVMYSGMVLNNDFVYYSIHKSNLDSIAQLNEIDLASYKTFLGTQLFPESELQTLATNMSSGLITSLKVNGSFIDVNGKEQTINSTFKTYNLNEFLNQMLDKKNDNVRINYMYMNNTFNFISIDWKKYNGEWDTILVSDNETVNDFELNKNQIYKTLVLNIVYDYLVDGYIDQVLNFKQLVYLKPNLNDLNYLWYNFVLFSNYNKERYPDIYDPSVHTNISNALVEYPTSTITSRTIELFGMIPVNNVILVPGEQKFQLFYKVNNIADLDDLMVALTAMTIKDYNAMINSPDFSTDGKDSEGKDKPNAIQPNWVSFKTLFTENDADPAGPKPAVFTMEVPSTTQPYMILIQVANKKIETDSDSDSDSIELATLVETRIEMQPNASLNESLNILGLFDEFVATLGFKTYSSSLISFGSTNKLFFSDSATPSYFPVSRVIQVPVPESIKGITIFQNKLIVATANSRFYVGGSSFDSSTDPFYLKEISSDSGLLAPKSDTPMGNYLYFLDTGGIKVLKNLYGTADKEFAYEVLDTIIKSKVPKDPDACGVAFQNKYYLCSPNTRTILIYNFDYKAWVTYESDYFNFSRMFVNNDVLYGVDRETFNIYRFDKKVYVDSWNEIEDGYQSIVNEDETQSIIQKGTPIQCELQTKNHDQSYVPHRKKYDWALLNSSIQTHLLKGTNIIGSTFAPITPYVIIDDDLINYDFSIYDDGTNTYHYQEHDPLTIHMRDESILQQSFVLGQSRLGNNDNNAYYNIPVKRSGNHIALGLKFDQPSGLTITSLTIRFGIRNIRKNRGGIS